MASYAQFGYSYPSASQVCQTVLWLNFESHDKTIYDVHFAHRLESTRWYQKSRAETLHTSRKIFLLTNELENI